MNYEDHLKPIKSLITNDDEWSILRLLFVSETKHGIHVKWSERGLDTHNRMGSDLRLWCDSPFELCQCFVWCNRTMRVKQSNGCQHHSIHPFISLLDHLFCRIHFIQWSGDQPLAHLFCTCRPESYYYCCCYADDAVNTPWGRRPLTINI